MSVSQTTFRTALFNADQKVPEGLVDGNDSPAGSRFSVYRNNVILSLTEALEQAFPLVYKLLGGNNFANLAALYVRENPPASPLMMFYGEKMPAFLEMFQPLSHIGYLPDCARLDLAMRQSYHAGDADPVNSDAFPADPQDLMALNLSLAPSSIILRSPWPLHDIWRVNFEDNAPPPRAIAQNVMITRPEFDPAPHLLSHGAAEWLEALENGFSLGESYEKALQVAPNFDLTVALSQALRTCALIEFKMKDT